MEGVAAFDVFLFDCDGVLFRGSSVIEGAPEVVRRLGEMGKRVFFVTNNATKSREDNVGKLTALGIPARAEQVICSSFAAASYARSRGFRRAFVVGESGLRDELAAAGVEPAEDNCDVVVAGLDRHFSYDRMAAALEQLQRGAEFVATNRDATYPGDGGRMLPGAGSIITALETCSGRAPHTTGKPSEWFVQFVKGLVKAEPSSCLMVGDRLDTDVAFGRLAGFKTLLVTTTGVHGAAHLAAAAEYQRPHFAADSVASLMPHLS
jgi:4-nitrophenyl phosphatase